MPRSAPLSPRDVLKSASRIVIKVSSVLVTEESRSRVKASWLESLAEDVCHRMDAGQQILIVTSGAIALGRPALGISPRMASARIPLDQKQAAASVGQIALLRAYQDSFARYGRDVAQLLLSPSDTENRRAHLNARATVNALLGRGLVPIVNENDTVATHEIRFGDNDRLAARVAQMIEADLLVLLSTVDGLYTADPRKDPSAAHVPLVTRLDQSILAMAGDSPTGVTTGGMITKLEAARIANESGIHMILASGHTSGEGTGALSALCATPPARATLFKAHGNPTRARKRWIQAHVSPKGSLIVDQGAVHALEQGKSLLPVGVIGVEGTFERGDAVRVLSPAKTCLAVGLCAFGTQDARRIMGCQSADIPDILGYSGREEMIRRDDLVLLQGWSTS